MRSEEGLFALAGPDFVPVSMRNATVFGVSPRLRLDIVLNNLAAWSHTTGRIRLLSDGMSWRPMIHVRDVAKAALAMLEAPEEQMRGEAFNVGSDDAELPDPRARGGARRGHRLRGRDRRGIVGRSAFLPGRLLEARTRRFPIWRFDWDAEKGATELVDAYRRVGLTVGRLRGRPVRAAAAAAAPARRRRAGRRAPLAAAHPLVRGMFRVPRMG